MARQPAPKPSAMRRFRQILGGLTALSALMFLLFVILEWRVNTPEDHLNLGRIAGDQMPAQKVTQVKQ